jgi:hypothetical protein
LNKFLDFCRNSANLVGLDSESDVPHPIKAEVQSVLEPFHSRIRGVVEQAFGELRQVAALRAKNGLAPLLYSRTISNDVFDAIARYVMAEFCSQVGVDVRMEAQTFKVFFQGKVCARFKRGDDNNLGQSSPTQAALAFEDADAELPGFPAHTARVEIIWLANDLNTRLEHVLVVARDGDLLLWEYEIEAGSGFGTITPFPQPPAPLPDDDNLITPKTPGTKNTGEVE